MTTIVDLKRKSIEIRIDLMNMIYQAKFGHTGSSLSNADILTALFFGVMNNDPNNPKDDNRDRYIQSKGHAVESYWVTLAHRGFIEKKELDTFVQFDSRLIGHPNNEVPGVEMNTGALGHGLSIGVGMAIAAKKSNKSYKTFVLMGDGEQAEGSIWEAAMAGSHYKLDNLIGIIDKNNLQITGSTDDVMSSGSLSDKWKSFGWEVVEVDGHDLEALVSTFKNAPIQNGKPTLVIANTTKGKGVSFAENVPGWHHRVPTEAELTKAIEELMEQLEELK